jgi:hypothetical protein
MKGVVQGFQAEMDTLSTIRFCCPLLKSIIPPPFLYPFISVPLRKSIRVYMKFAAFKRIENHDETLLHDNL